MAFKQRYHKNTVQRPACSAGNRFCWKPFTAARIQADVRGVRSLGSTSAEARGGESARTPGHPMTGKTAPCSPRSSLCHQPNRSVPSPGRRDCQMKSDAVYRCARTPLTRRRVQGTPPEKEELLARRRAPPAPARCLRTGLPLSQRPRGLRPGGGRRGPIGP